MVNVGKAASVPLMCNLLNCKLSRNAYKSFLDIFIEIFNSFWCSICNEIFWRFFYCDFIISYSRHLIKIPFDAFRIIFFIVFKNGSTLFETPINHGQVLLGTGQAPTMDDSWPTLVKAKNWPVQQLFLVKICFWTLEIKLGQLEVKNRMWKIFRIVVGSIEGQIFPKSHMRHSRVTCSTGHIRCTWKIF